MKSEWEDIAIKQYFEAQRQREEEQAPSFQAVLERPARPTISGLRPLFSMAALLVLLILGALVGTESGWFRSGPVKSAALPEWNSPTDFLLSFSQAGMLETQPSLDLPEDSYGWAGESETGDSRP